MIFELGFEFDIFAKGSEMLINDSAWEGFQG